uniref:ATP-dependent Clp protease proteolytic subunit n=1 Tax=Orobanche austrohispanica TaxID=223093 RepID=A0A1C8E0G8_9LAMI|nr:Clp protease subunit [Orobanche austrohispanica]ALJ02169.1 Clp protease subunit [Orobanche austrohispanica]
MPIRIPKVPFSIPGNNKRGWDLISNEFFQKRIFFLFGDMNEESVNNVIGGIIYFNQENPTRDQLMFINSRGGKLGIGLALYQTILWSEADITTIGLGRAAGTGCLALAAGNTRLALPSLLVKMREPSHSPMFNKQAIDLLNELALMKAMYNTYVEAFSEKTGQPIDIIKEDMKNNTLMTANEAYNYGIIDQIVGDVSEIMKPYYSDKEKGKY